MPSPQPLPTVQLVLDVVFPDEVRKTVIGLARDLRGLVFAFNTKISYMMLFDWIYPAYTPILHRAVEIWYQDPQVIITSHHDTLLLLLSSYLNNVNAIS